jgi:uncharacterized protein YceH (UPF0502 family)
MHLTHEEVRVLASLVEKQLSTPQYYPLSLNALVLACNQKSNRDPVTDYEDAEVEAVVEGLLTKRLLGRVTGAGSRVVKYRHTLLERWSLPDGEMALLAELMLRGPQTTGELRARAERMHVFDTLDQVETALHVLEQHDPPLATLLPRQPGQKEARYAHLLAGTPTVEATPAPQAPHSPSRVASLEAEVAALTARIEALEARFDAFRQQFE